jgi:hypothetical protein
MHPIELRGDSVVEAPQRPGLYAWYYRPINPTKKNLMETLGRLLTTRPVVKTTVTQRYGVRYISETTASVVLGADEFNITNSISDAFEQASPYLLSLFQSNQFVYFYRPIYIGIAKNLRERIYSQHYTSLLDYWDDENGVSKFLESNQAASVDHVMKQLDLPHTFALEARFLGISPRDLVVCAFPTDLLPESIGPDSESENDSKSRRSLERLLQLISDPVCGRR